MSNTAWFRTAQENQKQQYAARGLPSKREEQWKYTEINWVEEFLQKPLIKPKQMGVQVKAMGSVPQEIILCSIQEALEKHAALIKPYLSQEFDAKRFPFAAVNTALLTEGTFLFVPKNCVMKTPIQLLFCNSYTAHLRNIVVLDSGSECSVIEEHVSNSDEKYLTNVVNQIHLENNAQLNYYKIQDENTFARHLASTLVEQKQNSTFKMFNLTCGAIFSRDDLHVSLQHPGASCYLTGLYQLMHDNQYVDHHVHVDHLSARGNSSMVYKGILDNKSRAVFNGKVLVAKDAQQIHAHQANHNLLLTDSAEVNTKPELEIYADDVKCTHGATVGQLDEEALFYLRSRGIDKVAAERIMVDAFAADFFHSIEDEMVLRHIKSRIGV